MSNHFDDYDYLDRPLKGRPYEQHSIPDPCIVIKIDGTYDAWSMSSDLRCNGKTRDEALMKLDQLQSGAFV